MSTGPTLAGAGREEPGANKTLPVLHVTDIAKSFGGAKALDGVSFTVMPGEVHGLLGKNGSGKSTLVKILAGFHAPDPGGTLEFNGEHVHLPLKPGDFRRLGMSFVHQNLGLALSLTVLENLRFAHLTTDKRPFTNWRAERRQAARPVHPRRDLAVGFLSSGFDLAHQAIRAQRYDGCSGPDLGGRCVGGSRGGAELSVRSDWK